MGTRFKKIIASLVFLTLVISLKAQEDSLAIDSVVHRIRAILDEYNTKVVFIDTSDYEQYFPESLNLNLQIASSRGFCNEIVRLVGRGADVNNFVGENATPLHYAVAAGKRDAAEILLLLAASPNSFDLYGNTPLIAAVKANDLEMAELLIRYRASILLSDRNGSSPLHHAAALGFFYLSDMLLYYDAPVELTDLEGNTPLMVSVWAGNYDITDILLSVGSDPNAIDNKGFTPPMMAAQNGDTIMLRMLINAGANMYAVNNDGFDALCIAARNGRRDAVSFLLENGNRWTAAPAGRENPINVAMSYGNKDLIPLLKEGGIQASKEISFSEITFSTGGMASTHYALFSGGISLREPRLKAGITAGADFNPVRWRLLVRGDDDIIYQYRLQTSVIHAGIFKELTLYKSLNDGRWSAVTSVSAGYRLYSTYSGTRQKPADSFCIIPAVAIEWTKSHYGFRAGIIYMKTPFYQVSPLWFSLGCSFKLFKETSRSPGKKIRIYNYE